MNKKTFSGILMAAVLMMIVLLCPARADAATVIYVREGVTGNITFGKAPVPNAKWKVKNTSILKLKSSTSKKAVYTGKKAGKTTVTAKSADRKMTAKCTITIKKFWRRYIPLRSYSFANLKTPKHCMV